MSRTYLMSGLILSLGFSVSWNPALQMSASRNSSLSLSSRALAAEPEKLIDLEKVLAKRKTQETVIEKTEVAVTDPKTGLQSFELEKVDPSQKGLKVFYELDETGSERKVRYYVEGVNPETCSDCLNLGKAFSEPLKDQNVKNIEMLNRMIAEMAISKIERKKAETEKKPETEKKEKTGVTTACEDGEGLGLTKEEKELLQVGLDNSEETETRLNCKLQEFETLASDCDSILSISTSGMSKEELKKAASDRRACLRNVGLYYQKYLKKDLVKGLSSKASSQENAIAAAARDNVLRLLPNQLSGVKNDILKVSQHGILERAQAFYNFQMANKGPNETAENIASKARYKMLMDLHGAEGAGLCSAYTGESAEACQAANTSPMLRASMAGQSGTYKYFNENFLSPMEKFSTGSGGLGFDSMLAQTGVQTQVPGVGTLDPQLDPNLSKMPIPEGVFNARTGALNRGSGAGILLPPPGSQNTNAVPSQNLTPIQIGPAAGAKLPSVSYPQTSGQLKPGTVPAIKPF